MMDTLDDAIRKIRMTTEQPAKWVMWAIGWGEGNHNQCDAYAARELVSGPAEDVTCIAVEVTHIEETEKTIEDYKGAMDRAIHNATEAIIASAKAMINIHMDDDPAWTVLETAIKEQNDAMQEAREMRRLLRQTEDLLIERRRNVTRHIQEARSQ